MPLESLTGAFPKRRGLLLASLTLVAGWSAAGCVRPDTDPVRYEQLGMQRYESRQYIEAIAMFEAALEHNRESPELYCCLGRCHLGLADEYFMADKLVSAVRCCDQAEHEFRHAYEVFPGYVGALRGHADALKRKGEHEAALALADWAAETCGPRAKMYVFQAREYAEYGDADHALAVLQKAVSIEPNNAATHAELGRFHARYGNRREAIDSLRRASDLKPDAPGVRATLAALESTPLDPSQPGSSSLDDTLP